ncbi:hypothetical protein TKK_0010692 [Trichogramma kaykai]
MRKQIEKLQAHTLGFSASEMSSFTKHFGVIVGDLIPTDDVHYEGYRFLRKLISIIDLKTYNEEDIKEMKDQKFGKIILILITELTEADTLQFIISKLNKSRFDDHYQAYRIEDNEECFEIINYATLRNKCSMDIVYSRQADSYVVYKQ